MATLANTVGPDWRNIQNLHYIFLYNGDSYWLGFISYKQQKSNPANLAHRGMCPKGTVYLTEPEEMLLDSEMHWAQGLEHGQDPLPFHCVSAVIHSNSGFLGQRLTGPPWVRDSLGSNRHAQKRQVT